MCRAGDADRCGGRESSSDVVNMWRSARLGGQDISLPLSKVVVVISDPTFYTEYNGGIFYWIVEEKETQAPF